MIVQTESIPSSPGTIFPRTSSKPQSQKSCQFSCKSHEQEKLKLIWCICSEKYKLYFSLNSNRDECAEKWAQGFQLKTWFSIWSQWDWFGERLWLKNSRHYNTRPLPPLLNHHTMHYHYAGSCIVMQVLIHPLFIFLSRHTHHHCPFNWVLKPKPNKNWWKNLQSVVEALLHVQANVECIHSQRGKFDSKFFSTPGPFW